MPEEPVVSIQILSWDTLELTRETLDALFAAPVEAPREVLVLDNGSQDGTFDMLRSRDGVRAFRSEENLGYAKGHNRLAREARGTYLCLLGSDTRVRAGAIDALVAFLDANPQYGACAPRLVDVGDGPDRVQTACMRFPTIATALVYDMAYRRLPLLRRVDDRYYYRDFDHLVDRDVEQPPGTCLVLRRDLWESLGGFDEELWLFFNDVDLCRRIRDRDLSIRYLAGPTVEHHEGASTSSFGARVEIWARNRIAYYRKHYGRFGAFVVRAMTRLRALQEWFAIGRRYEDKAARTAARRELKQIVRAVLAPRSVDASR